MIHVPGCRQHVRKGTLRMLHHGVKLGLRYGFSNTSRLMHFALQRCKGRVISLFRLPPFRRQHGEYRGHVVAAASWALGVRFCKRNSRRWRDREFNRDSAGPQRHNKRRARFCYLHWRVVLASRATSEAVADFGHRGRAFWSRRPDSKHVLQRCAFRGYGRPLGFSRSFRPALALEPIADPLLFSTEDMSDI